jgi:hypothetical protein
MGALRGGRHPHSTLDRLVRGDLAAEAGRNLARHFGGRRFGAADFDRFGGGGDALPTRDRVMPADMVALSLLAVERGLGPVAVDFLSAYAEEIGELLAAIPCVALHDAPRSLIGDGSAAAELADLLRRGQGPHGLTTCELLARKRPHLVPLSDVRARATLGVPGDLTECLWSWFDDDPSRVDALTALRDKAVDSAVDSAVDPAVDAVGGIAGVSLLRCLDVAMWLHTPASRAPSPRPRAVA